VSWREVIVAMLKPKTDFGWHHRGHNDGDAGKMMRRSLSSIGFEARVGRGGRGDDNGDESDIADDAESKTVLQIHDAGKIGVEMDHYNNPVHYNNPPPTCHLVLWSDGGGEEKESRDGVLLQGGNKIDDSDDSSVGADGVDPGDHTVSAQVVGSEAPRNGGSGGGDESRMAVHRVDDNDDEESSVCFAEDGQWFLGMTFRNLGGEPRQEVIVGGVGENSITRNDK
jgi:hypothetical protein